MSQKTVWVPEIGQLTLSKRRGTRNLRLSINAKGQVRVGMPAWVPYSAGISFALSRREWLVKHQATRRPELLVDGGRVGKSYRLKYIHRPQPAKTTTRITDNQVIITSNLPLEHPAVQAKSGAAAERALKKEAENLLPRRLAQLAAAHRFQYQSLKIKKLSSRWGSCSSHRAITLNYFLMQLPWDLIDYVIIHELVHTKHLNHSPAFWVEFESILPNAKQARKLVQNYKPVINTVSPSVA